MNDFQKSVEDYTAEDDEYCRVSFVRGARYAAQITQELGEILQKYTVAMHPKDILTVQALFAKNKEIADE